MSTDILVLRGLFIFLSFFKLLKKFFYLDELQLADLLKYIITVF